VPKPNEPGQNLPVPTIQITSLEITGAMDTVAKNPKDPDAHLGLALALMDAKQIRPAMEELVQAANLAGPNNKDFFMKAADQFAARGHWVAATSMYLRLVPMYRNKAMPKEMEDKFHEAVYKSAEQKDLPLFVTFERIDSASLPLGYIARGRHALYNGSLEDAKAQLDNAQKIQPYMYEVYLLRAEIDMKDGNQAEAKKILLSISSAAEAPEWIRVMAENYLKTIK
jgi:tetratricopeptide (TPR) repeat protein